MVFQPALIFSSTFTPILQGPRATSFLVLLRLLTLPGSGLRSCSLVPSSPCLFCFLFFRNPCTFVSGELEEAVETNTYVQLDTFFQSASSFDRLHVLFCPSPAAQKNPKTIRLLGAMSLGFEKTCPLPLNTVSR